MNGKKDIKGWASLGISVVALIFASGIYSQNEKSSQRKDNHDEVYIKIVDEIASIVTESGGVFSEKPTSVREAVGPLFEDLSFKGD